MPTMQWNRGFQRLTLLVSCVVIGVALLLHVSLVLTITLAAVPWVIFLAARWLVGGFRSLTPSASDAIETSKLVEDLAARLHDGRITHEMAESLLSSLPPEKLLLAQQMNADAIRATERKIQDAIEKRAREGKTLSLDSIERRVREDAAHYDGPDRERYVQCIEERMNRLRETYGPDIPVDEAYRLMKEWGGSSDQGS